MRVLPRSESRRGRTDATKAVKIIGNEVFPYTPHLRRAYLSIYCCRRYLPFTVIEEHFAER